MSSLRKLVSENATEIRDGICNVIVYKVGRSWECFNVWSDLNGSLDSSEWEPEDVAEMARIAEIDPNAVVINGSVCGHIDENMTVKELIEGVRWHYERGALLVQDYVDDYHEATQAKNQQAQIEDITENADPATTADKVYFGAASNLHDHTSIHAPDPPEAEDSQLARCHGPPIIDIFTIIS